MIALLIDIGNSRVKWRIARLEAADAADAEAFPDWVSAEQATWLNDLDRIEAAFRVFGTVDLDPLDVALIANVASEAAGTLVETAVAAVWPGIEIQFVRSATASAGLVNGYRNPLQLGVDRWLAAVAAHALYADRSVLVCMFGTATTIDLIEHDRFVGGLILPGIEAMQTALTSSTARLPSRPGQTVDFGDCTEDAITSGVMTAQIGAVERALRKANARLADAAAPSPMCLVAGGAAGRIPALFDRLDTPHRVVHDLVLRGLAWQARELVSSNRTSIPATIA